MTLAIIDASSLRPNQHLIIWSEYRLPNLAIIVAISQKTNEHIDPNINIVRQTVLKISRPQENARNIQTNKKKPICPLILSEVGAIKTKQNVPINTQVTNQKRNAERLRKSH